MKRRKFITIPFVASLAALLGINKIKEDESLPYIQDKGRMLRHEHPALPMELLPGGDSISYEAERKYMIGCDPYHPNVQSTQIWKIDKEGNYKLIKST